MKIHYKLMGDGVEIIRCFGTDPCVDIPDEICGFPVVCVSDYAFSGRKDGEEENVLVWDAWESRLFQEQERLLAGEYVESVVFPDSVQKVGNYVFYGCQNLKSLCFSDSLTDIGRGAFTGCRMLDSLQIRLLRGRASCVPDVLGDLWQRIDVLFVGRTERSRLVFPEHYEEAVENTPARMLFTQHHGSGNNYRQCFYDRKMDYRKYDDLFPLAKAQDDIGVLSDLVFSRLLYPEELTKDAERIYEDYIKEQGQQIGAYLTDGEKTKELKLMSDRHLWTEQALDQTVDYAARTGKKGVLAFLMNEKRKYFPQKRGKYEL